MKAIRAVVAQIVERWHPDKIILFGSHAYGTPTPDSDVDLLVIMPVAGRTLPVQVEMRCAFELGFPIDLQVRTPEWIETRIAMGDLITQHWLDRGLTMHETVH